MGAPEKINVLLYEEPLSTGYTGSAWVGKPIGLKGETEYIRADAFIEKAVRWLNEHMIDYMEFNGYGGCLDAFNDAKMVEDFKNYMKGE